MFIIIFIVFLIIIATSIFLGRGKSLKKKKLFMFSSVFLILTGIVTTLLIKSILLVKLVMAKELDYIDDTFINWAFYHFNSYSKWSCLYVIIILSVLLFTLYTNKTMRNRETLRQFTFLCITSMGVILTASLIYAFSTINKTFNLPIYIIVTSMAQVFILYIPLVAMRLYIGNPEVENTIFTI